MIGREYYYEQLCKDMEVAMEKLSLIIYDVSQFDPTSWDQRWAWHCVFCDIFAARNCISSHAAPMRADEHAESCIWRRARALLDAADPHAKQDAAP